MPASLRLAMFPEHVGSEFEVLDDPSRIFRLILVEVVEHARTERNEAFSLMFHGPSDPFLGQGIHKLKHATLEELEIFLVPVGQDKDGFQYEAVFNHTL